MAFNLQKGQRTEVGLQRLLVGVGWDPNPCRRRRTPLTSTSPSSCSTRGRRCPMSGRWCSSTTRSPATARSDDDRSGANTSHADDETATVDLSMVRPDVQEILFVVTIHEAAERRQNFGQIRNSFIRVVDVRSQAEMFKFEAAWRTSRRRRPSSLGVALPPQRRLALRGDGAGFTAHARRVRTAVYLRDVSPLFEPSEDPWASIFPRASASTYSYDGCMSVSGPDPNPAASVHEYDLDASALLLDARRKIPTERCFVFFNNLASDDGLVTSSGDDRSGGQLRGGRRDLLVDLGRVRADVLEILFLVTIHEAVERRQNFGAGSQRVHPHRRRRHQPRDVQVRTRRGLLHRHRGCSLASPSWRHLALRGDRGGLPARPRGVPRDLQLTPARSLRPPSRRPR